MDGEVYEHHQEEVKVQDHLSCHKSYMLNTAATHRSLMMTGRYLGAQPEAGKAARSQVCQHVAWCRQADRSNSESIAVRSDVW